MRRLRYLPLLVLLAPVLMGPTCDDEVDLGGTPDAGAPGGDAGTVDPDGGTDPAAPDAGASDAGPAPTTGDPVPVARDMLIDVFDGTDSTLSLDVEVSFESSVPVTADVRAERLEVLAPDGTVDATYPLGGIALRREDYEAGRGRQRYSAFLTSDAGVGDQVTSACAGDTYPSRLLWDGVRIVTTVDGGEVARTQIVPRGSGGFPPMRAFVLCHEGVRVERTYEGFHDGFLGFTLRPDGLYEVEMWESGGSSHFTASAPLTGIDPTVRISPRMATFHPGYYPTFDAELDHFPCAPSGCTLGDATYRFATDLPAVPMRMPVSEELYWCAEPAPGDDFSGVPWHPADPEGAYRWICRGEVGGDGAGIARFTGTTEVGRFAVEVVLPGAGWRYADPSTP